MNQNKNRTSAIETEKPCDNYIEAWTTFRTSSKENLVLAEWLVSQPAWPKKSGFCLTDFGCGDGKVVAEALRLSAKKGHVAKSITLIDPTKAFLEAACQHVKDIVQGFRSGGHGCSVEHHLLRTRRASKEHFQKDVLLLVHVLYLMYPREFQHLVARISPGVPLYVVIDPPNSVFSQLWKKTSPKYLRRAQKAHEFISNLSPKEYRVRKSGPAELISYLNKSALTHHITGHLIVSMLCYNDKLDISQDAEFSKFFWQTVDPHMTKKGIKCQSVGYEIIKN